MSDVEISEGSAFYALFSEEEAAELEMRAALLSALQRWLAAREQRQTDAAEVLGIDQARVSDIKRGAINRFSLDYLIRLSARAGLRPRLELDAA